MTYIPTEKEKAMEEAITASRTDLNNKELTNRALEAVRAAVKEVQEDVLRTMPK